MRSPRSACPRAPLARHGVNKLAAAVVFPDGRKNAAIVGCVVRLFRPGTTGSEELLNRSGDSLGALMIDVSDERRSSPVARVDYGGDGAEFACGRYLSNFSPTASASVSSRSVGVSFMHDSRFRIGWGRRPEIPPADECDPIIEFDLVQVVVAVVTGLVAGVVKLDANDLATSVMKAVEIRVGLVGDADSNPITDTEASYHACSTSVRPAKRSGSLDPAVSDDQL